MTLLEMEDLLKQMLFLNDAQLNNDISSTTRRKFLNLAYVRVWNRIRSTVSKDASTNFIDTTWPVSTPVFNVPNELRQSTILGIYVKNSNDTTGRRIAVQYQSPQEWVWPLTGGPSQDQSIRIYFRLGAEPLQNDASTPMLLNPEHHELIVWEAAIYTLKLKNRQVPPEWLSERDDLEFLAAKDLMTKPLRNEARVRPNDLEAVIYLT